MLTSQDLVHFHGSAARSCYRALQGAGMGRALFIFQHKNETEKLKAALITNFREKGWSSHPTHTYPRCCTAVFLFQCPCIIPLPALASGCPQALVHISVLCWEGAEGYNAARKHCRHSVGSMTAWGKTQGVAKRRSVSRLLKESPAKLSAKSDLI